MKTVNSLLRSQLLLRRALPAEVLRAASVLSDDVGTAALLAARLDLPADLYAAARADRRPEVRTAFCLRTDLTMADLVELLGAETRAAVLAPVSSALASDFPVTMLLWQRMLAKPTKGLALALLESVARSSPTLYRGTVLPAARKLPPVPPAVANTILSAIGSGNHDRSTEHRLTTIAAALVASDSPTDAGTVELLAVNPDAPISVRAKLAASSHLSTEGHLALLRDLWEIPMRNSAEHMRNEYRHESFARRQYRLPNQHDLIATTLAAPDVPAEVLDYLRTTLQSLEKDEALPDQWGVPWLGMVDAYTADSSQEGCAVCAQRADEASAAWPPAGFELPDRDPSRLPRGLGAPADETDCDADDTGGAGGADSGADDDARRLAANTVALRDLDDYEIARLARDLDPAADGAMPTATTADGQFVTIDFSEIVALAHERSSTVLAITAAESPRTPLEQSLQLLDQSWCTPATEVVVRLVGARRDCGALALAATGLAPAEVLSAYGPAVFAAQDSSNPEVDGALRFAAQVCALEAGDDVPGWNRWRDDSRSNGGMAGRLAQFVMHPDTPDAALLAMPWPLVSSRMLTTGSLYSDGWKEKAMLRMQGALISATTEKLGANSLAWATYARLAETFTGTTTELLDLATDLSPTATAATH